MSARRPATPAETFITEQARSMLHVVVFIGGVLLLGLFAHQANQLDRQIAQTERV